MRQSMFIAIQLIISNQSPLTNIENSTYNRNPRMTNNNLTHVRGPTEYLSSKNPIYNYGRWCGPGHGGYDDCCNGQPCASCEASQATTVIPSWNINFTLNLQCLKDCPPVDSLDLSCAQHDTCCNIFGEGCGILRPEEHCFCNALLSHLACHFSPISRVCLVFNPINVGMGCWACGSQTKQCFDEDKVYQFGSNLSVSLAMLESFNTTGVTQFYQTSKEYHENC
jgi:hypothetical protein